MTRGGSGAVAFVDGQEIASVPGVPTDVVDFGQMEALATATLLWLAAGFTLVSGLQYLAQGMRFLNAAQDAEREEAVELLSRHTGEGRETGRLMEDPWCARLAAEHLIYLVTTGEDMEKDLVAGDFTEIIVVAPPVALGKRRYRRHSTSPIRPYIANIARSAVCKLPE